MNPASVPRRPERLLAPALSGALRGLRRERWLSAAIVATLGLALAGVATVSNVVDRLYLRPWPGIRHPERIDRISAGNAERSGWELTWEDWSDVRRHAADVYETLTASAGFNGSLLVGDRAERVAVFAVDEAYFELFGVAPRLGRLIDRGSSLERVAVLSERLWRRVFGADARAVGRSFRLNGQPFTVVGVAPGGFRGTAVLGGPELWVPLESFGGTAAGLGRRFGGDRDRRQRWLRVIGRRVESVPPDQAQARLDVLATQLDALPEHGDGYRLRGEPLASAGLGGREVTDRWITLFAGAVALVLIAACANVGGLLTGKLLRRGPELAVRLALGESRRVLVASLLAENSILALAGALLGLAAAALSGPVSGLGPLAEVEARPRLAAAVVTLGIAVACALAIGLFPAWRAARSGPSPMLRGAQPAGGVRFGAREVLVSAQVAVCFVVVLGSALTTRTVRSLRAIPLGFEPSRLVAASVDVAERGWDPATANNFFRALIERLVDDPAIDSVGLVAALPMLGSEMSTSLSFEIVGRPRGPDEPALGAYHALADPGLLPALGAEVIAGRGFLETDGPGAAPVALVNEAAVRAFWPGASPLGAKVLLVQSEEPFEVVGVVADARLHGLEEAPTPGILLAHAQAERSFIGQILAPATTVLLRARSKSDPAIASVRRHLRELEPELPLFDVTTLEQRLSGLIGRELLASRTFTAASLLALVLSMLGTFAAAAHSVAERTRELGVRSACGATPRDLVSLVLRRAVLLSALGAAVGALAAGPLGRQVESQLRDQSPVDPGLWAVVSLLLIALATLSVLVPARRAAAVDPVRALRAE